MNKIGDEQKNGITIYRGDKTDIPIEQVESLGEFVNKVEQIACEWREFIAGELRKQEKAKSHPRRQTSGRRRWRPVEGGPPLEMPGEKLPGEFVPWFRGVTYSSYRLEPSLLREDGVMKEYNRNREQIRQVEKYMLRRFKAPGGPMANLSDTREINWRYLMQHYGLPTRLLDWSKNALTALYFAIRKHGPNRERGSAAVWVLNPRRLNYACGLGWFILDPADEQEARVKEYLSLERDSSEYSYPIPLIPSHVNPRLTAQHSRFTLHTEWRGGLTRFAEHTGEKDKRWHLVRIEIPWEAQRRILRALRLFGVTQPKVTPDLDSLAVEIRHRMMLGVDDLNVEH
jgi:hypothetical protein